MTAVAALRVMALGWAAAALTAGDAAWAKTATVQEPGAGVSAAALLPPAMAEAAAEPLPAPSLDPLVALADAEGENIETGVNAVIAQSITALGNYTGLNAESWRSPPGQDGRTIVARARKPGTGYADPGMSWNDLASHTFGDNRGISLGLEERFADSRNMATSLRLRHAAGPVDVRVNLKGQQSLATSTPVQLSYESSATYALNSLFAVGMRARGNLGTFDNFAPGTTHDTGAFARLNLLGNGKSLSAETGYDRKVGAGSIANPAQFRASLNFNWKL